MTTPGLKVPALDPKSPVPLHAQAEEGLRQIIQQPKFKRGGLLPDEVSLSNLFGVSRNTLRTAIGRLVTEGRLERKAGVGTRVIEPRVQSGVGAWHSFTREMEAKGIKVETYFTKVQFQSATEDVARALQLAPGAKVMRLDRVRGWNGRPEVHFCSYLHPRLKLPKGVNFQRPLYELIKENCSVIADQSQEELTAVAADRRLAPLLHVSVGAPLLRRERTVLDAGQRPMEFAIVHYRCDRFQLTLNLRQK
jgi:GntR family transcriptional regulator